MSYQADIVIIGAGIVGLAIASEVAREGREVYVVEKNESFGQEQSSRNSEVIHAGIYYEQDSLKTRLCLEGNKLLYEICERQGITYNKCGKIIVATNDIEAQALEKLFNKGKDNGVPLRMLSKDEMCQQEPNISGVTAFFSPTTGIVDSYELMRYFLGQAVFNGAQMVYRTEVIRIEKLSEGYDVMTREPSGDSSLRTKVIINCAGLYSGQVAEMARLDPKETGYKLHWCKGEYYTVGGGKNRRINRLIYPVPMDISVGVHVCLDVNWRLRLGPLFYYVDEIDYKVDDSRKQKFMESNIMRALPFIESSDLEPESAGIMAMLQGEGEDFRDFVIRHEYERGFPGLINLVGIETPGLTASPAIARYVSQLVDEIVKI